MSGSWKSKWIRLPLHGIVKQRPTIDIECLSQRSSTPYSCFTCGIVTGKPATLAPKASGTIPGALRLDEYMGAGFKGNTHFCLSLPTLVTSLRRSMSYGGYYRHLRKTKSKTCRCQWKILRRTCRRNRIQRRRFAARTSRQVTHIRQPTLRIRRLSSVRRFASIKREWTVAMRKQKRKTLDGRALVIHRDDVPK